MNSKALATMKAGAAALLPIYPETFDDVVRLARMAIISGMIKPLTKGWGESQEVEDANATEARATMIIMQGMELGVPPMQAIQLIAMINGRMVVHSEGVPGILLSKGFKIEQRFDGVPYEDNFKAVCTLTRPDGEVFVGSFSVADAKEAGLWQASAMVKKKGKGGSTYEAPNDSPWFKYRKRMLWARALGFASKDGGSDAMRGMMVREEVEDMLRSGQAIDITPTAISSVSTDVIPDFSADSTPNDDESGLADSVDDATMTPEQEAHHLDELKADLALATSYAEREEVAESYEDVLNRMSDAGRRRAEAIFEGREK